MAENKTKPTKLGVTAFIASVADETRRGDAKVLVKLMQAATGEAFEIDIPMFLLESPHERRQIH